MTQSPPCRCVALQEKAEKRLEAEQKRRAKFRTEVNSVRVANTCPVSIRAISVRFCVLQVEKKVKELLSDGDKKELPFPKVPKVYRAIL